MHKSQVVLEYILTWIADALSAPSAGIDTQKKFRDYKIKMADFFSLNSHYHLNLDPTTIYAFPAPAQLAAHSADLSHGLSKKRPNKKSGPIQLVYPVAYHGVAYYARN